NLQRSELLQFRTRLLAAREELANDKSHVEKDLRRRTEEINRFASQMAIVEKENQHLKDELKKAAKGLSRRSPSKLIWALVGTILALLLLLILPLPRNNQGDPKRGAERAQSPAHEWKFEPVATVIKPVDAATWEGKEVTVEFAVGSTHNGLD